MAWLDLAEEEGRVFLLHAFVSDAEGRAVDAAGRRSHEEALADFEAWEPDLVQMDEAEVLRWGDGREPDAATEAAVAEAMEEAARVAAALGARLSAP
jgi:hypothetical protein